MPISGHPIVVHFAAELVKQRFKQSSSRTRLRSILHCNLDIPPQQQKETHEPFDREAGQLAPLERGDFELIDAEYGCRLHLCESAAANLLENLYCQLCLDQYAPTSVSAESGSCPAGLSRCLKQTSSEKYAAHRWHPGCGPSTQLDRFRRRRLAVASQAWLPETHARCVTAR